MPVKRWARVEFVTNLVVNLDKVYVYRFVNSLRHDLAQ